MRMSVNKKKTKNTTVATTRTKLRYRFFSDIVGNIKTTLEI